MTKNKANDYGVVKLLLAFFCVAVAQFAYAQTATVTLSGTLKDKNTKAVLSYVNVLLKTEKDTAFVSGTMTGEQGMFSLSNIKPGAYFLEFSYLGYTTILRPVYVGSLSKYLDISLIELEESANTIDEVEVTATQDAVNGKMDKKTYSVSDNISQNGGSVLQTMQNLPGVTVQDGKVQLRGNDKVTILIDGKQTAMTGYGGQTGLDNIPVSAIEKIEIINNPSAKYEANGNAGIINIVYKKNSENGFYGKAGLTSGLGALWIKQENLPTIRPQYQFTPKINPSLSLNYKKNKINAFLQADYLYTQTLNKNEFVTRTYDDGTIIKQQTKRNRNTSFVTSKLGLDWNINKNDVLTFSGMFGSEKILDRGDEPFFNNELTQRLRLWQFLEDELKTTAIGSAIYQHAFKQAGHQLRVDASYTYHRENEKYFFDNIMPTFMGKDAFKLLSDEHIAEIGADYTRPLKYGQFEGGVRFRRRTIPTDMLFIPGLNSPLDTNAGGKATYKETIPALYGNYIYENKKMDATIGLRLEYVGVRYEVDPRHNTYKSDGYNYTQPFPSIRLGYKISGNNKLSLFYNRRVDRPNEVDIRIFPKYDDAEIIKVGNPALRPQFTNSAELGWKSTLKKGYLYAALYYRMVNGTITRISTTVPGSTLIYAVFQNAQKSYSSGIELLYSRDVSEKFSFNINMNVYYNRIDGFSVVNKYPQPTVFTAGMQEMVSGNLKANALLHFAKNIDMQITAMYFAPDIVPQGKTGQRFSLDVGIKRPVQKGKGEIFANATDLLNTMVLRKQVQGNGFNYTSNDYYETQVIRVGYNYKF